jgi:hypothetical protein
LIISIDAEQAEYAIMDPTITLRGAPSAPEFKLAILGELLSRGG